MGLAAGGARKPCGVAIEPRAPEDTNVPCLYRVAANGSAYASAKVRTAAMTGIK
jgi:hypothetical protein